MNQCVFCEEANDFASAHLFLGKQWPYRDRVVYSDPYIFTVVGYSPQVCPYILIIPRRHIFAMSEMNAQERNSFMQCLNFLLRHKCFDSGLCFFEHGGMASSGSSSIDHCHIHVISREWTLFHHSCLNSFSLFSDLDHFISDNYLLVGEYIAGQLLLKIAPDNRCEHQFFRKLLAEVIGETQWDWRKDMRIDKMITTMSFFSM